MNSMTLVHICKDINIPYPPHTGSLAVSFGKVLCSSGFPALVVMIFRGQPTNLQGRHRIEHCILMLRFPRDDHFQNWRYSKANKNSSNEKMPFINKNILKTCSETPRLWLQDTDRFPSKSWYPLKPKVFGACYGSTLEKTTSKWTKIGLCSLLVIFTP